MNNKTQNTVVPWFPPPSRYQFFEGKMYILKAHVADQILLANDEAVRAAVRIIESFQPNNPEMVLAVRTLIREA